MYVAIGWRAELCGHLSVTLEKLFNVNKTNRLEPRQWLPKVVRKDGI